MCKGEEGGDALDPDETPTCGGGVMRLVTRAAERSSRHDSMAPPTHPPAPASMPLLPPSPVDAIRHHPPILASTPPLLPYLQALVTTSMGPAEAERAGGREKRAAAATTASACRRERSRGRTPAARAGGRESRVGGREERASGPCASDVRAWGEKSGAAQAGRLRATCPTSGREGGRETQSVGDTRAPMPHPARTPPLPHHPTTTPTPPPTPTTPHTRLRTRRGAGAPTSTTQPRHPPSAPERQHAPRPL